MTGRVSVLDSPILREHYRIFADAEKVIADPLVRNRGTVGGSLCQADPAEDLSAVLSALRAEAVIESASGSRTVAFREFHEGPYETVVGDAEILVEVRVPVRPGTGSAYEKVHRRAGDWAVAAAGAFVPAPRWPRAGRGHRSRRPRRRTLRLRRSGGDPPRERGIGRADPIGRCRLPARPATRRPTNEDPEDYKRHLAEVLVERALRRSIARASGEER